jgi:UTP--glucose-1-phosphate uridylyltransferase
LINRPYIIIVTGRGKRVIEDHFEEVQGISKLDNINYIRQKEPLGLGHAVYCASRFIGNEPFAVLLGDDIVYSPENPCLKQLIEVYERYNSSVIGVKDVPKEDVSKYGVIS